MIIVAGGQTGVDRAAHRAAMDRGLLCAGWCPPEREAEDGAIPPEFPVQPTPHTCSAAALEVPRSQRTEWNARDADATLILLPGGMPPDPGTAFAARAAQIHQKPLLTVDPHNLQNIQLVRAWIREHHTKTLNIAGPSEDTCPGIAEAAYNFLSNLWARG